MKIIIKSSWVWPRTPWTGWSARRKKVMLVCICIACLVLLLLFWSDFDILMRLVVAIFGLAVFAGLLVSVYHGMRSLRSELRSSNGASKGYAIAAMIFLVLAFAFVAWIILMILMFALTNRMILYGLTI